MFCTDPGLSDLLALVLTAGGLPLDLPCALLVRAVADGALVDLHLSARRDHLGVGVAVWTCGQNQEDGKPGSESCFLCVDNILRRPPFILDALMKTRLFSA